MVKNGDFWRTDEGFEGVSPSFTYEKMIRNGLEVQHEA